VALNEEEEGLFTLKHPPALRDAVEADLNSRHEWRLAALDQVMQSQFSLSLLLSLPPARKSLARAVWPLCRQVVYSAVGDKSVLTLKINPKLRRSAGYGLHGITGDFPGARRRAD
jgi:hypothetical protein